MSDASTSICTPSPLHDYLLFFALTQMLLSTSMPTAPLDPLLVLDTTIEGKKEGTSNGMSLV
jgi:hypothetical protein